MNVRKWSLLLTNIVFGIRNLAVIKYKIIINSSKHHNFTWEFPTSKYVFGMAIHFVWLLIFAFTVLAWEKRVGKKFGLLWDRQLKSFHVGVCVYYQFEVVSIGITWYLMCSLVKQEDTDTEISFIKAVKAVSFFRFSLPNSKLKFSPVAHAHGF